MHVLTGAIRKIRTALGAKPRVIYESDKDLA